jgi:hypothetical protein
MAKDKVREQLRNEAINAQFVLPRELNERATVYLRDHVEVWKEAIAMAHRLDDKEGKRKERQRLRRKELAQLRKSPSVVLSGSANPGTDKSG